MSWEALEAKKGDKIRRVHEMNDKGLLRTDVTEFIYDHHDSLFLYTKEGGRVLYRNEASYGDYQWKMLRRAPRERQEEDYPVGTIIPFKSPVSTGFFVRVKQDGPAGDRWRFLNHRETVHHISEYGFGFLVTNPNVRWHEAQLP